MGTQLGEAFIPIRATLDKLDGDLASARGKVEGAISKITGAIGPALQAIAKVGVVGVGAVAGAITAVVAGTLNWAEKLDAIGDVLGTTTQQSAALAVAVQHIGGNTEQLTGQIAFMTRGLMDATGQIGPTGTALKDLGVAFQDSNGNMRSSTDILQDVADKIGVMPDGLEKTSLMMDIFGKSGKDMSDLMGTLAGGGMAKFDQKAKDIGLSMSQDAVDGAINFNRTLKDLKMQFQGLLVQVGIKVMPAMQSLANIVSQVGQKVIPILVTAVQPLTDWLGKAAGAVGGLITALFSGQDPLFAITDAIMRVFGIDAALKFHEIAGAVMEFVGQARDFLVPILQQVGDFITGTVLPAVGEFCNWLGVNLPIAIQTVTPFIQQVADWLGVNLPIAIQTLTDFWNNKLLPAFSSFADWLKANWEPLLAAFVAVIAVLVIPAFISWAVAAGSAAIATIAALAPVIAIVAAVGAAVFLLYKAWDTNFLGIKTTLTNFWNDTLKPVFTDIQNWLATNIPLAITTAKGFWDNTLAPALSRVWQFIKEHLWPAFLDVGEWLLTTIGTAISAAAGFWKDTLQPALTDVWSFIKTYLWPAFVDIATWLGDTIGQVITTAAGFWKETLRPALEDIWKFINESLLPILEDLGGFLKDTLQFVLDNIAGAFNGIRDAVGWVIDKIGALAEALSKIKIPDWLQFNSPTPLEMGLRGIAKQLQAIDQLTGTMPLFHGLGANMPALAMAGSEASQNNSSSTSYSANTTIYTNRDPLRVLRASRHLDKLGRMS